MKEFTTEVAGINNVSLTPIGCVQFLPFWYFNSCSALTSAVSPIFDFFPPPNTIPTDYNDDVPS